MYMTCEHCIVPFPTVLALWYAWVYTHTPNCHNVSSNIETPVYENFSFNTTLSILNIYLDDYHV